MSQDKLTSDCSDGYHCDTPPQSANFDDANEDTKLITNSDATYNDPVTSSTDHLASYDAISEGNPFDNDPDPGAVEQEGDATQSLFVGQEDEQPNRDAPFDVQYVRDVTALRDVSVSVTASQFEAASHRAARSCELLHQGPTFSVEALHHGAKSCEMLSQAASFDRGEEPAGMGLQYEEFWPKATVEAWRIEDVQFECFSDLVERGSAWLWDHTELRLLNCETAEKKITNLEELYSDQLQYLDKGCTPVLVKGLRLWLAPSAGSTNNNKSQLRFVDIVPQCTSPGNQDVVTLADFYDDLEDAGHGKPQYETLGDALDRYNASLTHTPLKGRILTVETVGLTVSRDKWDGNLDPAKCSWVDRWLRDRFFLLRVFYLTGPPAHERIGLADFVPDQDKDANPLSLRTTLSRFDTLVDQARDWLNTIQGIRVTNVQTVDTKYTRSVEFPSLNSKEKEAEKLQTQQSYEFSIETRPRALFLRVAYVLPMEGSVGPAEWPLPMLNCHTFEPAYMSDANQSGSIDPFIQLEGLTSLGQHVSDWLIRKGGRALCAQVLQIPQGYDEKTDLHQRTLYSGEYEDGYERVERLNCIQMLRVFMDGPAEIAYTEDGTLSMDDVADVADEYDTLNEPSCCNLQ